MRDLFDSDVRFSPIAMQDADVSFLTRLPMPDSEQIIFERLHKETVWLHGQVVVWGKKHFQPRLTAWYGDPGKSYNLLRDGDASAPMDRPPTQSAA